VKLIDVVDRLDRHDDGRPHLLPRSELAKGSCSRLARVARRRDPGTGRQARRRHPLRSKRQLPACGL